MKTENPVGWFEIYVDDLDRAKRFYENVFETELSNLLNPTEDGAKMMAFPMNMNKMNGVSGTLIKMDGIKSGGNSTVVYFTSEDCMVEQGKIEKSGGKLVQPKTSLGDYGFAVLGEDTEGNIFGIHSMK